MQMYMAHEESISIQSLVFSSFTTLGHVKMAGP